MGWNIFKVISHNFGKKYRPTSVTFERDNDDKYLLKLSTGIFSSKNFQVQDNISAIERITDENQTNFADSALAGALGGFVFGAAGLLAGALSGGSKNVIVCAIEIFPKYKILAELDAQAYRELSLMASKNRAVGKILPDSDIIKKEPPKEPPKELPKRNLDDLIKLKQLLDMGVITQAEFDSAKKKFFR